MNTFTFPVVTAFAGSQLIARGPLHAVASQVKANLSPAGAAVLVFDDSTGQTIEVDWRGTEKTVLQRIATRFPQPAEQAPEPAQRGPGRPRLGVVAREVTLLPRHWEWLNRQTGGASVALRKLVEQARRTHQAADRIRQAQETCYRFMSVMAGNQRQFEEATRALFAADALRFKAQTRSWPKDVREHVRRLAVPALEPAAVA